jgi:transcription antitermination factor NusG
MNAVGTTEVPSSRLTESPSSIIAEAPSTRLGCYALKVRPRGELAVGRALKHKGYDILLPTYIDRREYSDRTKKVSCALFPGYIFVRMNAEELLPVVSTEGVSYLVKSGNTLHPLPPEEETVIEALCQFGDGCQPCPNFTVGNRVSIESGPLRGLHGILVRIGKNDRIVIHISSVHKSVSVDLRDTVIKALD